MWSLNCWTKTGKSIVPLLMTMDILVKSKPGATDDYQEIQMKAKDNEKDLSLLCNVPILAATIIGSSSTSRVLASSVYSIP